MSLRSKSDQAELVKACYYDDPVWNAASRFAASAEFQEVVRIACLKPNSKVLDFGAGRGIAAFGFATLGHSVTALEPDPSLLVGRGAIEELCQQSGVSISILSSNAERIDSADNEYDLAYCRAAMHHANSVEDLCKEIFRVLRPGGMLIATREHVLSHESDLELFLASHPLHHLYGGEMAYTLPAYINWIKGAGFHLQNLLGKRQSLINAFPATSQALDSELTSYLISKLGLAGRLLARHPRARAATARWLDRCDHEPGRLYSFVARKPIHK